MGASTSSHKKQKYRKARKTPVRSSVELAEIVEIAGVQMFDTRGRPGGKLRFVPEKLLGSGGLCEVFSATDLLRLEYATVLPAWP